MSERRSLSLAAKVEHRLARWLATRSPELQLRLCGNKAICLDGQTLHPEMQLILALRRLRGTPPMSKGSPGEARRRLLREALTHAGDPVPVGAVRELQVDGAEGKLRARHYLPPGAGPHPLLVFYPGGGFVLGGVDTHDPLCRWLCREAQVQVLSVEYRKAPEDPFPAAVDDVVAAFRWAVAHAEELGADPVRIGVGGDSAGANLAAVVAQLTTRDGGPRPTMQLLIYPVVDRTVDRPSVTLFADGFFLTRADLDFFTEQYTGVVEADLKDPRISPLHAPDLSGLPPAYVITAGFDPLRDEGEEYAEALKRAGTPTVLRRFERLVHGFANMTALSRAAHDAVVEIAQTIQPMLHGTNERVARTGSEG